MFAIAYKSNNSFNIMTSKAILDSHSKLVTFINYALKCSSNPFFVSFLEDEKYFHDIIGFYNNGTIEYIDNKLNRYLDIQSIIKYRYGCIEKYNELKEDEKIKAELIVKLRNTEYAKSIIRNDYSMWEYHFPKDTLIIYNLFINEMDSIVKLTSEQKQILKYKLIEKHEFDSKLFCDYNIVFLNKDVTNIIKSVLTKEQFIHYQEQRTMNLWFASQASNTIYLYYNNLEKDSIQKAFRRSIFNK
jgi:hypothetical protein